jgi:orotidine-5'-phosphate decarboxylase
MAGRDFNELLKKQWDQNKFVCVGLDTDPEKIPESAQKGSMRETVVAFNRVIVDATKDIVCAYKPNSAFYEAYGDEGMAALRETIFYIQESAPDVPVILDAKRGDIANTNEHYARSAFDHLRADAITVLPFLGGEPLKPFFDRKEKGIIVLCHTSNLGAGEIQELEVNGTPLYKHIAERAANHWNENENCSVMVGATYPEQLGEVRDVIGDMPILIAGIGAQNGDLEKTIRGGKDSKNQGLIVNASRSIIFASKGADFAEVARAKTSELHSAIMKALVQ